jgi:Protein of unknown function (DUF2934)
MPAQSSPSPQRTEKRRQPVGEKRARAATSQDRRELNWEQIARRAYERFEARGGEHGRDQEDWFNAEQELRGARGE